MGKESVEQWFAMEETKGFKMAGEVSDYVNNMGHNPDEFVAGVLRQHRTLQQSIFRLFFKCIEAMAQRDDNFTDLRNRASRDTCRMLVNGYKEEMRKFYIGQGMSEERAKEYSEMDVVIPSNLPHI